MSLLFWVFKKVIFAGLAALFCLSVFSWRGTAVPLRCDFFLEPPDPFTQGCRLPGGRGRAAWAQEHRPLRPDGRLIRKAALRQLRPRGDLTESWSSMTRCGLEAEEGLVPLSRLN